VTQIRTIDQVHGSLAGGYHVRSAQRGVYVRVHMQYTVITGSSPQAGPTDRYLFHLNSRGGVDGDE
jgi:hypothetical protein